MYPFTSGGDHGISHGGLSENTTQNINTNPNMNSLGLHASSSLSSLAIPTFQHLNYSSCMRDCTTIDPLRACSSQTHRSNCNPWPRDHEDNNIPVNTRGLSPERELHHMSNNSGMMNCGNTSLSMGTVRMKKKARRKVREPRFCFKTLSDVDVLDDGYKWRKYGQKVVKNTQHPRSYYRCTQDNCRVKKRIERLAEDPRMVITTYEGRHAHSPSHDDEEPQTSSHMNFLW